MAQSKLARLEVEVGFPQKWGSARRIALLTALAGIVAFVTASAASPRPLDGPFLLPAGSTATFTKPMAGGCNNLTGAYRLDDGGLTTLVASSGGCTSSTGSDVTVGPFETDRDLMVALVDATCEVTYQSDGTPVDHVIVEGTNPYTIRFADGGGFCERARETFNEFDGWNFQVGLTITAPSSSTVALSPEDATIPVGGTHTVTATVLQNGEPLAERDVQFTVVEGPNAGTTGRASTGSDGTAAFTYSSSQAGTDRIEASFVDPSTQQVDTSNVVTANWVEQQAATPPPSAPAQPPKADIHVTVSAPSYGRVGQRVTFTASVANAGPDASTGVSLRSTATGATLVSASESRGNGCTGGTCSIGTLASGASATVTLVYTADQAGTVSVSASAEGDYDPNASNNAAAASAQVLPADAPPPPPPPPARPATFNAVGVGTVLVNGAARPADQVFQLNAGDTVDVTNGVMTMTTSEGSFATFSSSQPTARRRAASATADNLLAQFTVDQAATGGVTTLSLAGADFSTCTAPRVLSAPKQTPIRQLWGSAKGNFTTKGRFAAATVRGTIWLVQDRCDGTLTQVVDGVVDVVDSTLKKTVSVSAGQSYLAPATAPRGVFKPPASTPSQTATQVKRRGLVWGGKTYRTRAGFTTYLVKTGRTWQEFVHAYPKLAAALASR